MAAPAAGPVSPAPNPGLLLSADARSPIAKSEMSLELRTRELPPAPPGVCRDCVYAAGPDTLDGETYVYECHRFPPAPGPLAPRGTGDPAGWFALVKPDWWCGEWQPAARP